MALVWIYTRTMPLLAAQNGPTILSPPEFGSDALLIVILLAALGAILVVCTLFWLNRRMKKVLGLSGSRPSSQWNEELGEDVDPWAEAGRRVDREIVDSMYEEDDD